MSNWQEWAIALTTLALAGAVLSPLVPKTGAGRLFRPLLSVCFVSVLLLPLIHDDTQLLPNFSNADPSLDAEVLQEKVRAQVEEQINTVLTESANEALKSYRLSVKKAEAVVDIDTDNRISITQVRVYPDSRSKESPTTVLMVLRTHFGTQVVMVNDG